MILVFNLILICCDPHNKHLAFFIVIKSERTKVFTESSLKQHKSSRMVLGIGTYFFVYFQDHLNTIILVSIKSLMYYFVIFEFYKSNILFDSFLQTILKKNSYYSLKTILVYVFTKLVNSSRWFFL